DLAAAVAAVLVRESGSTHARAISPWDLANGWMIAGQRKRKLAFQRQATRAEVTLVYTRQGLVLDTGKTRQPFKAVSRDDGRFDVFFGDIKETASCIWEERDLELVTARHRHRLHWVDLTQGEDLEAATAGQFKAPMPGAIREILAQPGDVLKQGAPVLIMEAMKMEHTLRAPV